MTRGPSARRWTPALLASCFLLLTATALQAQAPAALPPVTVGAGVQTAFVNDNPDGADSSNRFELVTVRLYVNGPVTNKIKFTFNTEYDGIGGTSPNVNNRLIVLDAIGRFEFSPKFNIWAGRFLPPSDRANLYGPYYAHHWDVYTSTASRTAIRSSPGAATTASCTGASSTRSRCRAACFDGVSATGGDQPVDAGRVQVDFWDPEGGYYLNGTYYGDKNLLAVGVAGQVQGSDKHGLERRLPAREEGRRRRRLHGRERVRELRQARRLQRRATAPTRRLRAGQLSLPRRWAPRASSRSSASSPRRTSATGSTRSIVDYDQKTTELNLNYIIKEFNARVMIFYLDTRFDAVQPNDKQFGVGLQLQM